VVSINKCVDDILEDGVVCVKEWLSCL